MKKKARFLSMALAILMILPMLLALPVNATEPEVGYYNSMAYAEADDGELLYKADFRGDTHWTPSVSSNEKYNDVTMEASGDGNSATFTSLSTDNKRAMWGGDLTPDLPLSDGVQYTFLFHLVLSSSNTPYFGYYLDGTQGIVIKGDRKANLFQWGSTKKTATVTGWISWGNKTDIEGLEQDFAVTFDYDTKTSALYVKNSKGFYTQVLETVLYDTTLDGATALSMSFFAQGSNADATATVSDFRIYKGMICTPLSESYQNAADGDLLYSANFLGDSHWVDPGTETATANAGWNWNQAEKGILTGTVDPEDSAKASFELTGTQQNSAWGADLAEFPLESGYSYTFNFTVTRTSNTPIGLLIDGHHGGYFYATKGRVQKNGNALTGHAYINYGGNIPGKSPSAGSPSVQEYAITVTNVHYEEFKKFTYTLYVRDNNGSWVMIDEGIPVTTETREVIGLYFYSYHKTNVTVSDVKVYKGVALQDRVRTVNGAAVRLDTPTGLRFTGLVDKTYLNGLKTEYGAENVKIGMVITPTEFLTDNSLDFTIAALDACEAIAGMKYAKIEAVTILEDNDEDAYKINCVLSDVKAENYTHAFSAITYVEVNGEIVAYSNYSESLNSRSIASVAEAAYNDISDTQTGEYQYQIGDTSTYSPYTEEQRAILQSFFQ